MRTIKLALSASPTQLSGNTLHNPGSDPSSSPRRRRGEALYPIWVSVLASVEPLARMLGNIIGLNSLGVTLVVVF